MICEEIFDETSHPSIEEIRDYATKIGIDPESEPNLLPLAAEGLMKALPPGWRPILDEKSKSYYYVNKTTGKTQWEHPLDDVYRGLVVKKRAESQSLSIGEPTEDATYNRDELPSFEEPVPTNLLPKPSTNLLGARKRDLKLSPLSSKPPSGFSNKSDDIKGETSPKKLAKQKSEDLTSNIRKIGLGLSMFSSFDEQKDNNFEKHPRSMQDKNNDFILSGGGSKFLKSNTKKQSDEMTFTTKQNDELTFSKKQNDDLNFKKQASTPDFPLQPRSILRERTLTSTGLGNLETSKSMDFDSKLGKLNFDIDDDKKSVRFNLNANPDILFDFSDKSDDEKEFKHIDDIIKMNIQPVKKSRFVVSPVINIENSPETNLKLIKPNPGDFIKPKLKLSNSLELTDDSDDDSIMKNAEKKVKSLLQKFEKRSVNSAEKPVLSQEAKNEIIEQAEKQFEAFRTSIWEQKSKELDEFKEKVQESHKKEMERILIEEKTNFEQNIKAELENLRLEMENRSVGTLKEEKQKLEDELETSKDSLEERYKEDQIKHRKNLLDGYERKKKELEVEFDEKLVKLSEEFDDKIKNRRREIEQEHDNIIEQLKENHSVIIEELKREFKIEEQQLRKEHKHTMEKIKNDETTNKDSEISEQSYEKLRSEKKLLEDKYKCLKEKYLRLKNDVKQSIEKRNKKRESTNTTGSETEISYSVKKSEQTPANSPLVNRKNAEKPPVTPKHKHKTEIKTKQILIQDLDALDTSVSDKSFVDDKITNNNKERVDYDSSEGNINPGRSRKKLFSRLKSSSASRVQSSNGKSRKTQRSCSPVENLRRQLQKLEDLEDQLPENPQADPYHLKYPFMDAQNQKFEGSSELEFFRHRIHLERDSIKRAKESLRSQKSMFQQRQKELKLKHGSMARHTLQQLCQEEKDLTDMEVSLHRSRSLLGEKVIRLRHLEQSLQRATISSDQNKQDDATLSDISSHSASSGISSTEFATADNMTKAFLKNEHLQESSEIIQSLENLNSEIREIWEVLHKQQQQGNFQSVLPPLPLVYPDLGWPLLAGTAPVPAPPSIPTLADRLHNYRQHVALANAQSTVVTHATQGATTTLVERTRNLRHWLRQAGIDPSNEGANPQATL